VADAGLAEFPSHGGVDGEDADIIL